MNQTFPQIFSPIGDDAISYRLIQSVHRIWHRNFEVATHAGYTMVGGTGVVPVFFSGILSLNRSSGPWIFPLPKTWEGRREDNLYHLHLKGFSLPIIPICHPNWGRTRHDEAQPREPECKMHVDCWIQQVSSRVCAVTCLTEQLP